MDIAAYIDTPFLVLRTTRYSDSSLIVAGIAPEHGQLHFLCRGARRLGAKRFPVIDLFRLLQVQYRPGNRDLQQLHKVELTEDYGAVARHYERYQSAGWLARFALGNVPEELEHRAFFRAMCLGLQRLARVEGDRRTVTAAARALKIGICLTFLREAGLLADYTDDPRTREQCRALLDMAAGIAAAPKLTADTWVRLEQWTIELLRAAECHLPDAASRKQ